MIGTSVSPWFASERCRGLRHRASATLPPAFTRPPGADRLSLPRSDRIQPFRHQPGNVIRSASAFSPSTDSCSWPWCPATSRSLPRRLLAYCALCRRRHCQPRRQHEPLACRPLLRDLIAPAGGHLPASGLRAVADGDQERELRWTMRVFSNVALFCGVAGIAQFCAQFVIHGDWLFDFTPISRRRCSRCGVYNTVIPVGTSTSRTASSSASRPARPS